jgi:NADPH-dependent 2,4-dienoyl-CoA reductase/sulfur reductase-like enzyme
MQSERLRNWRFKMKVIVIGGVAAGMSCASKVIRSDKTAEVVVYEKGGFLSYGACGLPYYIGDFNDDHRRMIARTKAAFEETGIRCHLYHEVTHVDVQKKAVTVYDVKGNRSFAEHYDKLMIACGANAVMPPLEGSHLVGVHSLKTMEEGIFLREFAKSDNVKNVTIVGGGYIGIECAEAFLHLGKKVRVIEAADRILPAFDKEMAELAKLELQKKGVALHLSETVKRFYGQIMVEKIETDKGSYDTDIVIVAVGIRPATDFLENTGIHRAEKGAIIVNRKLETSIKDVYAAGDCILVYHESLKEDSYLALGTTANKCGRIAGANIAGENQEFLGALGSAAIKVCDLELGRTGMGEADAGRKGIAYKTVLVTANDHPAYYPDPTPIVIKLIYEEKTRKLLGAQTCGLKGAVLRVDVFAVAIHSGMTCDELGMTDLVYAPPFAGVWDAIHIACNAAK